MSDIPKAHLQDARLRKSHHLPPLIRDLNYLTTYGCYPKSGVIELATDRSSPSGALAFRMLRLRFDIAQGKQSLQPVAAERWRMSERGTDRFELSYDLDPGYYLLLVREGAHESALPFTVDDKSVPAKVAVIRPTFTQWSYHADGFYPNEKRRAIDRLLGRVGSLGSPGRLAADVLRPVLKNLRSTLEGEKSKMFPAHAEIDLQSFYRRNNRWNRLMWDEDWGCTEGLWVDEVLSGMPIFAVLDKNNVPYHVYTDVDLHNGNAALAAFRVLIFSGQEGMTSSYYRTLKKLQSTHATSFLLWGVQAFGYRQLEYDSRTGVLQYICTRGRAGLWGDRLEDQQPDWADEGQLFGFHFPEPTSATWRFDKLYGDIRIAQPGHPIVSTVPDSKKYSYAVHDVAGQAHPGLTWAGGEVQKKVMPEASVIAHLDEQLELVGIGEYQNTIVFSPTYLPAFFAYQAHKHPEIEMWFMGALNYLIGQDKQCGFA